ncbi:unnamed protein product [Camellia sinensis]
MATYFHGSSEIQADGLQTLYLMNPNYVGYSDNSDTHQQQQLQPHQPPSNLLLFNSPTKNALNSHAPPPQNHHFVGIPLPTVRSAYSDDPNRSLTHEIPTLHGMLPRFQYNSWGMADQTAMATSGSGGGLVDFASQLGFRRPVVPPTTTQQGLSLSLSSQQPTYRSLAGEHDISGQAPASGGCEGQGSGGSYSSVSNGISGVILGSKYLTVAQQLLDEVVNVGKAIKIDDSEGTKEKAKMSRESMTESEGHGGSSGGGGEASSKGGAELTAAQRQEAQMKKAKLVNMLDEVEQRYRQYHHQMQIVVSSFEQAAGTGSAKSYTALALQTISKQFRYLKDAITTQIKAACKSLGEDEKTSEATGSRLKFVDHQLRQQRALQQLGMVQQHNAWRPQRGLPERAVSVLRAWLFEHFLHPYPKDSDKHMLAKQTGLTRGQVSNWFINARVRLWKPMVEDMYLEEMKDQDPNGSENNMNQKEPNKDSGSKFTTPQENTTFQMGQTSSSLQSKQETAINHTSSPTEISNSAASTSPLERSLQGGFTNFQRSPKKPRSSDMLSSPSSILSMDMDMKNSETIGTSITSNSHGSGFGSYPIGDIGRFVDHEQLATKRYHGNSVSLTLGLPHCENMSLSNAQQNYISNHNIQLGSRLNLGSVETHYNGMNMNTSQPSHSDIGFENVDMQNRKSFAAQLLRDFVA